DHREALAELRQRVRPEAHDRGERHAVHVAGRRRLRRVHVRVRVEPDQADLLLLAVVGARDARHRAAGDRVVAADDERAAALLDPALDATAQAAAAVRDRVEVLRALVLRLLRVRAQHGHVAEVFELEPERLDAAAEPGDADRGGPHVDAAQAAAEVHGDAEESDALGHERRSFFFFLALLFARRAGSGAAGAPFFAPRSRAPGALARRGTKLTPAPRARPSARA